MRVEGLDVGQRAGDTGLEDAGEERQAHAPRQRWAFLPLGVLINGHDKGHQLLEAARGEEASVAGHTRICAYLYVSYTSL